MPNILRFLLAGALLAAPLCHAADGDLDPAFGDGGVAFLSLDGVEGHELRTRVVIALPDGKLLFGGSRNLLINGNPDPHMRPMLARMNADGSPDTGFGSDPANPGILVLPSISATGMQSIEAMRRLDDGSIVVAGSAFAFGPVTGFIAKFDADGQPDPTFGKDGRVLVPDTYLHALAVGDRGSLVVAGERVAGGSTRGFIGRLDAGGRFDGGFGAGADGSVLLEPVASADNSYITSLAVDAAGGIVVGGTYEDSALGSSEFSLARLDASGQFDTSFADAGWRVFRVPDDASTFNGIDALLLMPQGGILIAAHHDAGASGTGVVLGRLDAHGADDRTFGKSGYRAVDVAAEAWNRYASALLRQDDGKLLLAITYATPGHQDFLLARTAANGTLDAGFGNAGVVDLDLAPDGVYSDLTALTLQDGKPILAGAVNRAASSRLVDLAAARLQNGSAADDAIFANGFEIAPRVSNYDDLAEGRLGTSFQYNGITYRDCNGIAGVFPDGSTFDADYPGEQFIIEDATSFYPDFPDYGSAPNSLTFGDMYAEGTSVSIGGFVRATLDLDAPATALRFDAAYYENGPWGGIEFHVDAYHNGKVVASDMLTINDLGGRDNATTTTLGVSGAVFDSVKIYATYDGQPSAPRLMIDNLTVTPAP